MTNVQVRKKNRTGSTQDLIAGLERFQELLAQQGEDEAVAELEKAGALLASTDADDAAVERALLMIQDCFEGEHELSAYTLRRAPEKEASASWTPADALFVASTTVLSLVRRLLAALPATR